MTKEELAAMAHAMFGMDWQSPLARALDVNPRTVRRWAAGTTPVPDWLPARMASLTGATATHLTTDEWIVGDGVATEGAPNLPTDRVYVLHTMHPRFFARVVRIDPVTEEPHADEAPVHGGTVYRADIDIALGELHWIDPPPAGHDLTRMMEAACDAVERWEDAGAEANDDAED